MKDNIFIIVLIMATVFGSGFGIGSIFEHDRIKYDQGGFTIHAGVDDRTTFDQEAERENTDDDVYCWRGATIVWTSAGKAACVDPDSLRGPLGTTLPHNMIFRQWNEEVEPQ